VTSVPDWICEVLSPRTAAVDQGQKRRAYHEAGVEHDWLIDPTNGTLAVLERAERDYLIVLVAGRDEVVRAPPFGRRSVRPDAGRAQGRRFEATTLDGGC